MSKPYTICILPQLPQLTDGTRCVHPKAEPEREAVEILGNLRGVIFHEYVEGAEADGYLWASISNTPSSGISGMYYPLVVIKLQITAGMATAHIDNSGFHLIGSGDGWTIREDDVRAWVDHNPNEGVLVRNPDLQWRKV